MISPQLTEALRNEIRLALDDDGKPFTALVAHRVYDMAIAAKDFLVTAAGKSTAETLATIEDNQGPLENLTAPGAQPAEPLTSETFGARILRELIAFLPSLRPQQTSLRDLVRAIADARKAGMEDIAAELERKMLGYSIAEGRHGALTSTPATTDVDPNNANGSAS